MGLRTNSHLPAAIQEANMEARSIQWKNGPKLHPKYKDKAEVHPGDLADLKTSILPHSSALGPWM